MLEHLQICGWRELPQFVGKGFSHMITIGDHDDSFEGLRLPGIPRSQHLCLRFTDTDRKDHPDAPTAERLAPLFDWLADLNEVPDGLLVHCAAGISRSPAVAFLSLCYLLPDSDPARLMELVAVCAECSYIWPNPLVLRIGDAMLERDGALVKAVDNWRADNDTLPSDFA
jgi:predicted protein tyrosine phosphatase